MSRLPSQTQIRAWRSLALVHTGLVELLEKELWTERGLHFSWYDVLVTLRLTGGAMRMHELAEYSLLSRSAATRLVEKIEEAGLVERRICPSDRRGIVVTLTAEGRKVQERAAPLFLRTLQKHFGQHLEEEQAEMLASALERVLVGEGRSSPRLPSVMAAS